jgi:hypothetical protein
VCHVRRRIHACHVRRRIHACHMRRRIHACHMRRRIHACHIRRRIHAFKRIKSIDISTDEGLPLADQFRQTFELRNTYEEEDTCMSCEEEDTCM